MAKIKSKSTTLKCKLQIKFRNFTKMFITINKIVGKLKQHDTKIQKLLQVKKM